MVVLYGSSLADATLTTACDMATGTGGTETTQLSSMAASPVNPVAEITSQGISLEPALTAIPATPTGNGWIYYPGAGTFSADNWSGSVALSDAQGPYGIDSTTLRFFLYSGGSYTLLGSSVSSTFTINATRTVIAIPSTALASVTFAAGDGLYIDQWVTRAGGMNSGTVNVYESTTAAAGVTDDMQVTTSTFTPASTGPNTDYVPRSGFLASFDYNNNAQPINPGPYGVRAFGGTIPYTESLRPVAGTVEDIFDGRYFLVARAVSAPFVNFATNTVYSFTDALSANDSVFLETEGTIVVDALLSSDVQIVVESSFYVEANAASDVLGGGSSGPFIDSLSTSDALLEATVYLPTETNTISEIVIGGENYIPLDALTSTDSDLITSPYLPTDLLTGTSSPLEWDVYNPSDDALVASDTSSMTQSSPGGGPTNTTYSFTDALVASDALLVSCIALPLEAFTASDIVLATQIEMSIDANTISDLGNWQRWGIDALTATESMISSQSYIPTSPLSIVGLFLGRDSTGFTDALQAMDTAGVVSISAAILLYLSATWFTRDGKATWLARDGKAAWNTRDDKVAWDTRDDKVAWDTRDDLITWKARS